MAKGIFVSTNIKGKNLSFVSTAERENGMLFEKGDVVTDSPLVYNAGIPTGTAAVYVSGNPAWNYDTSSVVNQNEDEYVIPAGKNFRVYPLAAGDRFTVADYSITGAGSVAVGDTIGLTAGSTKLTVDGDTAVFKGEVVKVETQSYQFWVGQSADTRVKLVTIEVVKNG